MKMGMLKEDQPKGPTISGLLLLFCLCFTSIEGYDTLDPDGNITIKWDVTQWTADGYVAVVTIFNFQKYRHVELPGWKLGWTWAKKEVIWSINGGQATEQGDCSRFKGPIIPHSCKKTPTIVDLLPGTPYNQQVANCCKGGVISAWVQDPHNSVSSFQLAVGVAGTTNTTVRLPKMFTFLTPGPGYTCGWATVVKPSIFLTPDRRRTTQALMTWNVTCTYSQFLAKKTPTCCVSLSSFYNNTIVECPTCSCGCRSLPQQGNGNCVVPDSSATSNESRIECTNHMCPIRVHWHIKLNYKAYWRVKITITNFNYARNYTQWNLVAQHPNFSNLTQIYSFNYDALTPYGSINDTAMLWGVEFYNDLLMQKGNVQSELLLMKDKSTFSFDKGWGYPRRIYFNGDNCVMPPPDVYPFLPNGGPPPTISTLLRLITLAIFLPFHLH